MKQRTGRTGPSELEDKVEKNTQKEQEKEKRLKKKKEGLSEM